MNLESLRNSTKNSQNTIVAEIPLTQIKMGDYQRPVDMSKVRKIVREYIEYKNRPIEVSFRDGKYWCWDGQHRVKAHEMLGRKNIKAQVHYGLSYEQEAVLFASQHVNEVRISTPQVWNARVEAGHEDEAAEQINKVLKLSGYVVASDHKPNSIGSVSALQRLYNIDNSVKGIVSALKVIKPAWGGMEKSTHCEILNALTKFFTAFGMDDEMLLRLATKLANTSPMVLLRDSSTIRGRGSKEVAKKMVRLYNDRLNSNSPKYLDERKIV